MVINNVNDGINKTRNFNPFGIQTVLYVLYVTCVTVLYVNGHVSLMSIFFKLKLQWYIQNRGGAL